MFHNINIIEIIKRYIRAGILTYTFIYTRQSENCLINNINNYELIATAYHFQAKSDSLKHRGAGVELYMMSKSGLFNAYSSTIWVNHLTAAKINHFTDNIQILQSIMVDFVRIIVQI